MNRFFKPLKSIRLCTFSYLKMPLPFSSIEIHVTCLYVKTNRTTKKLTKDSRWEENFEIQPLIWRQLVNKSNLAVTIWKFEVLVFWPREQSIISDKYSLKFLIEDLFLCVSFCFSDKTYDDAKSFDRPTKILLMRVINSTRTSLFWFFCD